VQGEPERSLFPPYRLVKEFFPEPLSTELLSWAIANEPLFGPTRVGDGETTRSDQAVRRSVGVTKFGSLKAKVKECVLAAAPAWIEGFRLSPPRLGWLELELVAHNDGAFFIRHIDTLTGPGWAKDGARLLSAICYLHHQPKAFTGGCLRLFPFRPGGDGDHLDLEPEHNTLVVFPSWAPHEVLPIACPSQQFADSRFAVNIWLHAPAPEQAS